MLKVAFGGWPGMPNLLMLQPFVYKPSLLFGYSAPAELLGALSAASVVVVRTDARRYVWTRHAVHAQSAPGSKRYVVQAPDAENDPVHSAIAFINLLSAETIDNTADIKDQGARFLRHDTLDGNPGGRVRLRR